MSSTWITWREAQLMPEDGKRYEAIGGELYVTAAPSRRHQWVSGKFELELRHLLEEPGHGWVYDPPIGVQFPETEEGVQPDIIFVSRANAERLVDEGIRGAPDLVVEILSPATRTRDHTIKRKLYERQGVRQYWLADHKDEYVDVWDFESGIREATRYRDRLPVRLGEVHFGSISLPDIFAPER